MASYNRVVMIGNLTRDPEYKQLTSGQAVCRLGLASNRQFKNRQSGNMVQEVCYIDIDVWGPQAESCRQYLSKGRPILVEGRLKLDTWEDPNGQNRSKHTIVADRIVFLSSGAEAGVNASEQESESESNERSSNGFSEAPRKVKAPSMVKPAQESPSQLDPQIEKELNAQLDQIKKRAKTSGAVKAKEDKSVADSAQASSFAKATADTPDFSSATGEIDFKDEPPFQDDLPF